MIIRIEKSGGSFRGAGLYYLHDKQPEAERDRSVPNELKPTTDERVWFTVTRNCANFDPEKAFDEMWHVAESQQWLKQQVGGRTSGRACTDPVKTISISWHKDDRPTPDHMVDAADAYLKHMGWDGHQAVYVAHRDTEHSHIHIILNRVDHENGRTLDDYRDRPRSQKFALAYEKEHGKLWCIEREVRAAAREKREPEFDKAAHAPAPEPKPANQHIPHNVIELARPSERAFDAQEQQRKDQFDQERATLKAEQRAEREQWFKDGKDLFRQLRHDVYDAVRAEHKAAWRQYYKDENTAEKHVEAVSGDALLRAHHFARNGDWDKAQDALHNFYAVKEETGHQLYDQKAAIIKAQKEELQQRQKEACDALLVARKEQYAELLVRQREERAAMRGAHVQGQSAAFVLETRAALAEQRQQANDNRQPETQAPEPAALPMPSPAAEKMREVIEAASPPIVEIVQNERSTPLTEPSPAIERNNEREPVKDGTDLAASGIGAVACYIADQLAEMFAPTPPEVREARAKEEAKREAETPAPEAANLTPHQRHFEALLRQVEKEAEERRARGYWEERDKAKDFGRDR